MIEIKSRKSLGISPTDLAPSYIESSFNEGSINLGDLIGSSDLGTPSAFSLPVFHPGALGLSRKSRLAGNSLFPCRFWRVCCPGGRHRPRPLLTYAYLEY